MTDFPSTSAAPGRSLAATGERRLWWLTLTIWAVFILMETLIDPSSFVMATIWAAHGLLLMLLLRFCLERTSARGAVRALVFLVAVVGVALVQTALDLTFTAIGGSVLLAGLSEPPEGHITSPLKVPPLLVFQVSLRSYLWIYGLYAAAVALHGVARAEVRAREESYLARLSTQKAELDVLRLQVNPHFLFNALNSVAALAGSDRPREAERMAVDLARYYRDTFIEIDQDVLSLGEELENVETFVALEKRRLEKLALVIDCPSDLLSTAVPAMILQPIVENAIKYGVSGHDDPPPVRIQVRAADTTVQLTCESGLSPFPDPPGTGSGLENVRRRLLSAFGARASLAQEPETDGWRVVIVLPRSGLESR